MFEKLLSLLLHAKGGAVATVLVLGASGALVTATVQNGMTTVTITQPSTTTDTTTGSATTPTTTTNNTVTQTVLALFNKKGEDDPTAPATGNGCSDAAHATNEQVQRVDAAFKTDNAAVLALSKTAPKTDAAKTLVKTADNKIKGFRQVAVKAIHELFKSDACKGNDDADKAEENKDAENDDEDSTTGATGATGATGTTGTTGTTVAISGPDAKAIADAAIAAMDKQVTDLKTALDALPAVAPATTQTDKSKSAKSTNSTKGKGHSEGKSHNSEGED